MPTPPNPPQASLLAPPPFARTTRSTEAALPELLGRVYADATPDAKTRILSELIRPLGLLSLVAVAGGAFAPIRLRNGWRDVHVRLDDALQASPADVMALTAHVAQVSIETIENIAQWLVNNPLVVGSAAVLLLLQALSRRGRYVATLPAPRDARDGD
jgi:hypothetical protein